ncbi:potassium channel protein [Halomicrobium sp. ZPS1]|uniref:TrkA-N domain protein n=3 Tax=Haloarculaceae TaxID=1963268 RepID=C7P3N2_HALMD|nr:MULTISPECIES: NAD(P)-binding protein [Halomicrobium]ACV47704.1 TrkA-N domain protein [Halomicrobium mukohataei DSM 12286]QCD66157.1 potassium channel protein [Halomicrobium mukohataei]QFR20962.1 potassium channel protein [Halomicrobium sp. ZPS1]
MLTVLGTLLRGVLRRALLRRMVRPVFGFVAVVAAGVVGFRALAGVGVVDALFWLLDPTSIELHFQSHDGPVRLVKVYAIVVLSGLVVAGLWIGETLLSATFGGQIQEELRQMQIEQTIEELDDHVVVCGYGTFGQTVAAGLQERDRDVVVVEQADEQFERAIDDGHLAVSGDARQDETLTDAGVERSRTVIGAIDDTSANVQIAIAASQLAPTVELVVRAGSRMDEALARRAGADEVIVPEVVSGEQVTARL